MEPTLHRTFPLHAEALRNHRKTIRESQDRFWARFGVTQSRGSRFETGAEIPPPVMILLGLYFKGVVTDGDLMSIRQPQDAAGMRGPIPAAESAPY